MTKIWIIAIRFKQTPIRIINDCIINDVIISLFIVFQIMNIIHHGNPPKYEIRRENLKNQQYECLRL